MYAPRSGPPAPEDIAGAIAALGGGALTEAGLVRHVHPLFSRTLEGPGIYLANHSLGRPLDRTRADVSEALAAWYQDPERAWEAWLSELADFRARIAALIGAPRPDCVVPRVNAAQGLRAVLNAWDRPVRVLTTRDEFDSVDFLLKVYEGRGRVRLRRLAPGAHGLYQVKALADAVAEADLVVLSLVIFTTGQLIQDVGELARACRRGGTLLLLDLYHAAGVVPLNVAELDADFAIGGCYKYLRGGPGAGWLYLNPRHLDGSFGTLDTGWFAQPAPFAFQRPETPLFAPGGDAFLESTPAILPLYQARAGLAFTLAVGVERLRRYSLSQQALLSRALEAASVVVPQHPGERGAFLALPHPQAASVAARLSGQGVVVDAREGRLRLCPDILNTAAELALAAEAIALAMAAN